MKKRLLVNSDGIGKIILFGLQVLSNESQILNPHQENSWNICPEAYKKCQGAKDSFLFENYCSKNYLNLCKEENLKIH